MPDNEKLIVDGEALYQAAADASLEEQGGQAKHFNQEQLLELSGQADSKSLMPLIQYLSDQQLLRTLKAHGKLQWTVRPRDAAKQIKALDRDDKVVYGVIEEAHDKGIWSRDIKKRSGGLADNVVKRSLEKMEKANLIKGVKSVKSPAQRTYMLAHLSPSEEVTGNSFYDAGDLDESFRDELMKLIVFWVRQQSWQDVKRKGRREVSPIAIDEDEAAANNAEGHTDKKRKRTTAVPTTAPTDIEDVGRMPKRRATLPDSEAHTMQLAHKAGTHAYPTAQDIYDFVTGSNVIKPTKASTLTVQEIQECINVLMWDERLEKIYNKSQMEWGYRTVRGVTYNPVELDESAGTALTQIPCGTCPAFDICEEGGPANPQECVYLDEWLKV